MRGRRRALGVWRDGEWGTNQLRPAVLPRCACERGGCGERRDPTTLSVPAQSLRPGAVSSVAERSRRPGAVRGAAAWRPFQPWAGSKRARVTRRAPRDADHTAVVVGREIVVFGGEAVREGPGARDWGSLRHSQSAPTVACPSPPLAPPPRAAGAARCVDDLFALDITTRAWRSVRTGMAPLPRRHHAMCTARDGFGRTLLLVFGGFGPRQGQAFADLAVLPAGAWEACPSLPGNARRAHQAADALHAPPARPAAWQTVSPVGACPEARGQHVMAEARPGLVFLWGGAAADGASLCDAWTLNTGACVGGRVVEGGPAGLATPHTQTRTPLPCQRR